MASCCNLRSRSKTDIMLEKQVAGVAPMKTVAFTLVFTGQVLQLFALSSLVATTPVVGALEIIGILLYLTASLLCFFLWKLHEFAEKNVAVVVTAVFCFLAATFIFLGLIVHGVVVAPYSIGVTAPYYSTTLIVCSALLAIGGGICLLLHLKGFSLTWTPSRPSQPAENNVKVKATNNSRPKMESVRGHLPDDIRPDFRQSGVETYDNSSSSKTRGSLKDAFNITYFDEAEA